MIRDAENSASRSGMATARGWTSCMPPEMTGDIYSGRSLILGNAEHTVRT
jgi:hypothetical protein